MKILNEDILLSLIEGAVEARNLEFKEGFSWNDPNSRKLQEETVKAVIAMANIQGGGDIVLGLKTDSSKKKIDIKGVGEKEISSFEKQYEQIEQCVAKYSSQAINFVIYRSETDKLDKKSRKFIVFRVSEFSLYPCVCRVNGGQKEDGEKFYVLNEGFIYSRPRKAPWSSRKASAEEIEEIVRLSVDKYRQDLKLRGYVKLDSLVVKLKEERSDYE